MEYASLLAGEPWSDHPSCTHPLLALVAREVNDEISDAGRASLVPLIPSVIAVRPTGPRIPADLVRRCVPLVTPVVSDRFRRLLEQALAEADRADPYPPASAAPVLAGAIRAVVDFRAPDPDALLHAILLEAIATCTAGRPVQELEQNRDQVSASAAPAARY